MSDQTKSAGSKFSTDWLLRGVLTKIGDTFDRLTGRSYRPSSSLATSELIEKLKKLLDHEVRDGRFVPHNIKLKMQWDKFSTDAEEAIKSLENELTVAVVDHINDRRYHTYAPISLIVKPDYFTEGVKLLVSFDKFDKEDHEVALNVTVPQIKVGDFIPEEFAVPAPEPAGDRFFARYTAAGKRREIELEFKPGRRLSVGRGSENDLTIDDASVSKIHASLVVNPEGRLAVADTGSTNGTFVGGNRIAYGKAIPVDDDAVLKFGTVEVAFERIGAYESAADAPTEQIRASFEPPTVAIQAVGEGESPTRIAVIKKLEAPPPAVPDDAQPTIAAGALPRPPIDLPPAKPAASLPVAAAPRPADPEPAPSNPATDAEKAEPTADRIVLNFDTED